MIGRIIGGTRLPSIASGAAGVYGLSDQYGWIMRGRWPRPIVNRGELFCFCPSLGGEASSTTVSNLIGAARTLTLVSGTMLVDNAEQYGSRALQFTGSSYCTFPTTSMISGSGARSMCLWSKPTSVSGAADHMVYGTNGTNQAFRIVNDTNLMYGGFYGGGTSGVAVTSNVWTHWGLIYSGTTLTLYKNGVSAASTTITLNTSLSSGSIGAMNDLGFKYFLPAGSLVDGIRYWSSAVDSSVFVALAAGRSE
jgi:hypothetical protein